MKENFETVLQNHEMLIHWVMNKYHIQGYTHDDLMNYGRYITWKCYNLFDESKGIKFNTYLGNALHRECWRLHRLSQMEKRRLDSQLKPIDDYVISSDKDLTYADVLPSKVNEPDVALMKLYQSFEAIPESCYYKDLAIQVIRYKIEINPNAKSREIAKALGSNRDTVCRALRSVKPYIVEFMEGVSYEF